MKLHAASPSNSLFVTARGDGFVTVNGKTLERSLLLLPDRVDETWGPDNFAALTAEHLAVLANLGCDVVLLGTGRRQRFPPAAMMRPLIAARIPLEAMDTAAACRTYNILVSEGRTVAAALIVERDAA